MVADPPYVTSTSALPSAAHQRLASAAPWAAMSTSKERNSSQFSANDLRGRREGAARGGGERGQRAWEEGDETEAG